MSTAAQLLTADDLWRLPDDGMGHELIRGELVIMPPSGSEHGAIGMTAGGRLFVHVQANALGAVFNADTGFIIARDPDTVRAADAAFVDKKRIPSAGLPKKFFPGAPDLAVEVVSPSDLLVDFQDKVEEWLAAGHGWSGSLIRVIERSRSIARRRRLPFSRQTTSSMDKRSSPDFACASANCSPNHAASRALCRRNAAQL